MLKYTRRYREAVIMLELAHNLSSCEQLGQRFGISAQRVSQINIAGLARIEATAKTLPQFIGLRLQRDREGWSQEGTPEHMYWWERHPYIG